jgi:hypothetical protein
VNVVPGETPRSVASRAGTGSASTLCVIGICSAESPSVDRQHKNHTWCLLARGRFAVTPGASWLRGASPA